MSSSIDQSGTVTGDAGPADLSALMADHLDLAWRVASYLTQSAAEAGELVETTVASVLGQRSTLAASRDFKLCFLAILVDRWRETAAGASESGTRTIPPSGGVFALLAERGLAGPGNPARAILDRLDPDDVGRAIAELPPAYRAVTAVSLADELSYREIGAVVRLPVATVRARLHRGRALLKLAIWQAAVQRGLGSTDYAD